MKIAVCVPTRGRPEGLKALMSSLNDAAAYVGFDKTDPDIGKYEKPEVDGQHIAMLFGDDPTSWKWNLLARKAIEDGAEILILGADDIVFETPNWEELVREEFRKWPDRIGCVGFADGRSPDGIPHFALHKNWVMALNYFLPPFFYHWGVDTWTVDIARAVGRMNHATNIMCRHKTVKLTGQFDETHVRIRRGPLWARDQFLMKFDRYKQADIAAIRAVMDK